MVLDYYSLLGVAPEADLATIRQAYRKRAGECHPDHGGSHAEMLRINEAWSVLSNPETRARYDASRQQPHSEEAASFSREDMPKARRQAAEYPREWNQFEDWLDIVAADFSQTRYGKVSGGPWGIAWPTTYGSNTGWLFVVAGATAGVLLGLVLLGTAGQRPVGPAFWRAVVFGGVLFACGGAWVGRWLHEVIRDTMQPPKAVPRSRPEQGQTASLVIRCPQCEKQLRLPKVPQILSVICRKCGNRFDLPPSIVS